MFFFLINGPKPKTIQFRKVSDRDEKHFLTREECHALSIEPTGLHTINTSIINVCVCKRNTKAVRLGRYMVHAEKQG